MYIYNIYTMYAAKTIYIQIILSNYVIKYMFCTEDFVYIHIYSTSLN